MWQGCDWKSARKGVPAYQGTILCATVPECETGETVVSGVQVQKLQDQMPGLQLPAIVTLPHVRETVHIQRLVALTGARFINEAALLAADMNGHVACTRYLRGERQPHYAWN